MKTYTVTLPVTGSVSMYGIEAESEEEAIEKALNIPYDKNQHDLIWNIEEKIVQGNVFYGELSEAYAEEE